MSRAKMKFEYEKYKYTYSVPGQYMTDFVLDNGIILEAKGYFRPEAKKKMLAVKKAYPDLDIRFVFYSKDKRNIKWCEKYGFPYCIKTLPKEWLVA